MGGKLGTDSLGQFKLGASSSDAAVIVTGYFDLPTPAGRVRPGIPDSLAYNTGTPGGPDPGTPGGTLYDFPTPGRVLV